VAKKNGWARFVTAQNQFNLLAPPAGRRVAPGCVEYDLAVLPFFPLASGLLTGKYRRGEATPSGTRLADERYARALSERNFDQLDFLESFATAREHTLLELAFAWLAAQTERGFDHRRGDQDRAGAGELGRRGLEAERRRGGRDLRGPGRHPRRGQVES